MYGIIFFFFVNKCLTYLSKVALLHIAVAHYNRRHFLKVNDVIAYIMNNLYYSKSVGDISVLWPPQMFDRLD